MSWEMTTIGKHCTVTSSKRFHLSERSNSGVPFYCAKEIIQKNRGEEIADCDYISEEFYLKTAKKFGVPQENDLLVTTRGTIGVPYLYRRNDRFYFADGNLTWIKDFKETLLPKFLYYWFLTHEGQKKIDAIAKGTAQKAVPIAGIKTLEICLPPVDVQRQIVDILNAYDDLIENNQKQINLLEETAQRLYKEWFVDLRFPGHENTKIVDGIPEGWNRRTVAECLIFHGNGGWGKETLIGKSEYSGRVIRGTDIDDVKAGHFSNIPLRYHTENDIKKRVLKANDLIFELSNGNIDNIGRCLFIDDLVLRNCGENTICASFCKLLRPIDKLHAVMLYWEIRDMQRSGRMHPFKKRGSNGINNFDFNSFLNHELSIPTIEMIVLLETIMSKIGLIQGDLALLKEARDRLLPRLMNGEIEA